MGSFNALKRPKQGGRPPGKIDALLNEKLKNVEWGEYKLQKLFVSSNGDFDIQKTHINGKGHYVITAGLTNNGIFGKTDIDSKIFDKGTITVDMFGCAFYRQFSYKMVTHARVFSLKPLFKITDKQGVFLAASLNFLSRDFGYGNMCSWEKIKTKSVQLPVKCGQIDFEFMENFVAELESRRVAELESYLLVTGLKDYVLTLEEEKALDDFKRLEWKEFDITEIFTVKNTANILSSDIVENSGATPYLCASSENNGVSSYITYNQQYLEEGNCIFIGGKTFVVSYQEKDFYSNDSHNLALYLENSIREKHIQFYMATCLYKSLRHKYSWGDSVSKTKIKKDKILLPTKDGKVDYSIMKTFISAIQKLVIKDVVLYADSKIEATKSIVKTIK